ncbi:XrtA system polysaccharide chain length determinant [Marinobacter oulmenensis]|uniref:Polysaccharide chain length determinant protein (PEP-CTERM system associated) n=1 Tax=Marinobacter oulmenensis TaxID=643747 RepID=A0A840UDC4_9GAMM|nr:XrtA system polysaccharide chain length determinant [Marinobacter oulmenensis]MBB5320711.1 polysaccharide chain length determinant protein (PEP-CTERM system associated) [Marinobacter oulmenensis]
MDLQYLLDTLKAIRLELYSKKTVALLVFMLVTAGVLAFGYVMPKQYTSEAVLYADQSSILQPLLAGQAEVTQIERLNEAREMLQSRSFLEQIGVDTGLMSGVDSDAVKSATIARLRQQIRMRVTSGSFLELRYTSPDAEESFRVLSAVLNRFIERTVRKKRSESQGAFEFIDSQVQAYQRQLEDAEQRLKEFKSGNQEGTERSALTRIETLRQEIENLKLEIQQSEAEIQLRRNQLAQEEPVRRVTVDPGKSSAERRLASLRQELDSLLLRFHEKHPDVVSVKSQIADLEAQADSPDEGSREGAVTEVMENPVYENLKIELSESTTRLAVQKKRLASLENLLQDAFQRSEKVAENQAELAELTRDYDVTRGVYEDMLQRREKARLSMTLDVQGEGISYRIQEPATYPTSWDGLQLYQFGIAGPFLGSASVLGLLGMLVMFDQRIRSPRALQLALPENVPVLTSIPRYRSTWRDRLLRREVLVPLLVLAVFMAGYLAVLVFNILGIDPRQLVIQATELLAGGGN